MNINIEFRIFKLVSVLNFSLNWQFWFFGWNLPKKRYFKSKTEKVKIITEFCLFELAYVPNFILDKILNDGQNLMKRAFPVKNRKCDQHHWILHSRVRLATKFQLKQPILIFRIKFAHEKYFWSTAEKLTSFTEFYIFELV